MSRTTKETYMLAGHDMLELEGIVNCEWCYCNEICNLTLTGEECRQKRYHFIKTYFYKMFEE